MAEAATKRRQRRPPTPARSVLPAQRWLTIDQVCQRLGLSRATLHRWVLLGDFPRPIRKGQRFVRFSLVLIEAWERRQLNKRHGMMQWERNLPMAEREAV